jgi:hypothetical protein
MGAHNDKVTKMHDEPKLKLDPKAPGFDEMTRRRRRALARMQEMSVTELFALAVRAGRLAAQRRRAGRRPRARWIIIRPSGAGALPSVPV